MSGKKSLWRGGAALLLFCLAAGIILGFGCARRLYTAQYHLLARTAGAVCRVAPALELSLMQGLKEAREEDFAAGDALLRHYGYLPETTDPSGTPSMILAGMVWMLGAGGMFFALLMAGQKKTGRRAAGLTEYLQAVNLGRESVLPRQEDSFSHLEDEIFKTVTELRETRAEALAERQTLADNLADIAHQLKTPITTMSLMAQLLSGNLQGQDYDCVQRLSRQIVRLDALVCALLTLSKLDAGTLKLEKEPLEAYALLTRAAEPVEPLLRSRGQAFILPPGPPVQFIGDANWTAEALLNLIKNCSEHTPRGGMIHAQYSSNPLYTEILIEDSGPGFDPADLPRLFERFYRGKNSGKDSIGIGLALSKNLIERQNGLLRAENRPQGGARFIIRFYN